MSHYDDLTDEQRIKLARDAVKYKVPIAPRIALWLQDNGLYDQITNPRKVERHAEDGHPDGQSEGL